MKQETLEEAALKWFMTANKREIIFDLGWIKIFEAGAKWQAERMYSYDELRRIAYNAYCFGQFEGTTEGKFNKWIVEFKK